MDFINFSMNIFFSVSGSYLVWDPILDTMLRLDCICLLSFFCKFLRIWFAWLWRFQRVQGKYPVKLSIFGGLFGAFLMIGQGLWLWGRMPEKSNILVITSRQNTRCLPTAIDVINFDHLVNIGVPSYPCVKLPFFPFSHFRGSH